MAGLRTGYPGLTHTAKQIAEFIGDCDVFCEPFAGLGRVSQHVKANRYVVNDKSSFAFDYLCKQFDKPNYGITQMDFADCVLITDAPNVTFFFDPPWSRKDYAANPKTFCDRGVGKYYQTLLDLVPTLQGRWFVAGRASGGARSTVSVYFKDYASKLIQSERTINGYPVKTKLYFVGAQ